MRVSRLIFLFLLSSTVLAVDMRGLCFDRSTSLQIVSSYVSKIFSKHDKVILNKNKHCVEIISVSEKMDLFDKFISMNFKVIERYGDSSTAIGKECLFEMERFKKSDKKALEYGLGKKNSFREKSSNSSSHSVSLLRMLESKTAQLYVNEILITLSCKPKNKVTLVNISLGTKKTNVITSIEMRKSQRVNLAKIVDDLSNNSRDIHISSGRDVYQARKSKIREKVVEEFYLTLK